MKALYAAAFAAVIGFAATCQAEDKKVSPLESKLKDIDGKDYDLSKLKGKVVLFVNVATNCGYTKQYAGMQELYEKYEKDGFVLIGVPSNDFGEQEPKAESEILGFCKGVFGVTFPLTTKQVVKGPQAHPFYVWARETLGAGHAPRWNFHKYLVGRDGKPIAGYGSNVEPLSPELTKAIEAALAKP